jgi:hypothetical protein
VKEERERRQQGWSLRCWPSVLGTGGASLTDAWNVLAATSTTPAVVAASLRNAASLATLLDRAITPRAPVIAAPSPRVTAVILTVLTPSAAVIVASSGGLIVSAIAPARAAIATARTWDTAVPPPAIKLAAAIVAATLLMLVVRAVTPARAVAATALARGAAVILPAITPAAAVVAAMVVSVFPPARAAIVTTLPRVAAIVVPATARTKIVCTLSVSLTATAFIVPVITPAAPMHAETLASYVRAVAALVSAVALIPVGPVPVIPSPFIG